MAWLRQRICVHRRESAVSLPLGVLESWVLAPPERLQRMNRQCAKAANFLPQRRGGAEVEPKPLVPINNRTAERPNGRTPSPSPLAFPGIGRAAGGERVEI